MGTCQAAAHARADRHCAEGSFAAAEPSYAAITVAALLGMRSPASEADARGNVERNGVPLCSTDGPGFLVVPGTGTCLRGDGVALSAFTELKP